MWIPYKKTYTIWRKDSAAKQVRCEMCSFEYIYVMERKAYGKSSSFLFLDNEGAKNEADYRARKRVAKLLIEGCDPVPCPQCGHIQEHMFARARQLRYRWMSKTSIILFPVAVILIIPAFVAIEQHQKDQQMDSYLAALGLCLLIASAAITALVLTVWKYYLNMHYDPNTTDVESRLQLGRARATSKTEYQKLQAG